MSFHPLPKPLDATSFEALKEHLGVPVIFNDAILAKNFNENIVEWLHRVQAYLLGEQHAPPHPTAAELVAMFERAAKDSCACDACEDMYRGVRKLAQRYRAQLNDAGYGVAYAVFSAACAQAQAERVH